VSGPSERRDKGRGMAFRYLMLWVGPLSHPPIGNTTVTRHQRQARYRAALASSASVIHLHPPADPRSQTQRCDEPSSWPDWQGPRRHVVW
jgi:hypothetical protein